MKLTNLFSGTVSKFAHKVAVRFKSKAVTYAELDNQSDSIAHYLLANPLSRHQAKIGLYLEPSELLPMAILGILKAGKAYVPISVHDPIERQAYIAKSAELAVVLTSRDVSVKFTCFKKPLEDILECHERAPFMDVCSDPSALAYIIYTSGTTGKPKGVEITHDNVASLLQNSLDAFDFKEEDTWLLFHNHAFDFSVWEMWGAFATGATLVIAPYEARQNITEFYRLLEDERISILNQTPSSFHRLTHYIVSQIGQPKLTIRHIIFGGEKLNLSRLKEWCDLYPLSDVKLVNMYGITETTVHVTIYFIRPEDLNRDISLIGTPMSHFEYLIVNENDCPVADGQVGELLLAGRALSPGYHNNTALTNERFVCLSEEGPRFYRTGDLVYLNANRQIIYVGRKDAQIKIHGFRIELGEIENCIKQHPSVHDCVVIPTTIDEGVFLRAFVRGRDACATLEALRDHSRDRLPYYMVPTSFLICDEFPVTENGKINTQALLELNVRCDKREDLFETSVLQEITLIWKSILLQDIGPTEDLFAHGAHSLAMVQALTEVKVRFKLKDLPLADFIINPFIEKWAEIVEHRMSHAA